FEVDAKGKPVLIAAAPADAPGPTKAAAARKEQVKPTTVVAVQEPAKAADSKAGHAKPGSAKPARVTVADADGDVSAFSKVLGKKPGKDEKVAEAHKPETHKSEAPKAKPQAAVTTTGSLRN
ncbi:MAG: hypothetical protein ABN488_21340, partial [Methylobacteriaceae bacterium]